MEEDIKATAHLTRDTWAERNLIQHGHLITIQGVFKRRSFKEWITRQPKQLQIFKVIVNG